MHYKMVKKLKKDVMDFTKAGITLGVGSMISAKAGVPGVSGAFSAAASGMRIVAPAIGGMAALRIMKKHYKVKK